MNGYSSVFVKKKDRKLGKKLNFFKNRSQVGCFLWYNRLN